jgi:hypothetical protein
MVADCRVIRNIQRFLDSARKDKGRWRVAPAIGQVSGSEPE